MTTEPSIATRAAMVRKTVLALLQDSPTRGEGHGGHSDRVALLQAYLAEYQTITTRNTYWLALQYALLPILGAALAVLAQMWSQFDPDPSIASQAHRIIIWLAIVIVNVIIIAHTEVGWESYNNVVYLENYLRPRIADLFPEIDGSNRMPLLEYESYLRTQRGKGPKWWELPGPAVSLGLFVGGTALFGLVYAISGRLYSWTSVEWVAVPLNALLLGMAIKVTVKMVHRRGDIGNRDSSPPW